MNDMDTIVAIEPSAASTPVVASTAAVKVDHHGPQDWELLVSEGHVRGHRLLDVGKTLFWPALASLLFGGWLVWSGLSGGIGGKAKTPDFIADRLVWNPDHYSVVPGREERASYQLAWLEKATGSPERGLTAEAWAQLIDVAIQDVRAFGDKTGEWTALQAAEALNPKVTRPEKVLSEFKGDLARGIIAIPSVTTPATSIGGGTNTLAYVAAWVEGKFSFALLTVPNARYGSRFVPCYVAFEAVEGCQEASQEAPIAEEILRLRPQGGR